MLSTALTFVETRVDKCHLQYCENPRSVIKGTKYCEDCRSNRRRVRRLQMARRGQSSPLHLAVESEDLETVKTLLASGADPNVIDDKHQTPLDLATLRRLENIALELIKHERVNVNRVNVVPRRPQTTLHRAVSVGSTILVRNLLQHGANPHALDYRSMTPLRLAIFLKKDTIVFTLLQDTRVDVNYKPSTCPSTTHLHQAVLSEEILCLQHLLSHEANPNSFDRSWKTPLHLAISLKPEVFALTLLKDKRILVNLESTVTPYLHLAVLNKLDAVVKELLILGADPNLNAHADPSTHASRTPLQLAILSKHEAIALLILEDGRLNTNLEMEGPNTTYLHLAVLNKLNRVVKELLRLGADITHQDYEKCTPLDVAINCGNCGAVLLFCQEMSIDQYEPEQIRDESSPNDLHLTAHTSHQHVPVLPSSPWPIPPPKSTMSGPSQLYEAVEEQDLGKVLLLLDEGHYPNILDKFKKTPLYCAMSLNRNIALALISDGRFDVNFPDSQGIRTHLHHAIQLNDHEFVQELLNRGADHKAIDYLFRTPLHHAITLLKQDIALTILLFHIDLAGTDYLEYAVVFQKSDVVQRLLDLGADPNALNPCSMTLLHLAILLPNEDIALAILNNNRFNMGFEYTCHYTTYLHLATETVKPQVAEQLRQHGSDHASRCSCWFLQLS